jgi:hypothetical protein
MLQEDGTTNRLNSIDLKWMDFSKYFLRIAQIPLMSPLARNCLWASLTRERLRVSNTSKIMG